MHYYKAMCLCPFHVINIYTFTTHYLLQMVVFEGNHFRMRAWVRLQISQTKSVCDMLGHVRS